MRRTGHGDAGEIMPTMPPLIEVIAYALTGHDVPFPEAAVFGTAEPERITEELERFCTAEVGAAVSDCLFLESGQASVFGLLLDDGRKVVLRAHPPTQPLGFLEAVHRVQEELADREFPCPRPLLSPTPLARGHARVEELVDGGTYADAHRPEIRRAMAETLFRLVDLTRDLRATRGLRPGMLSRVPAGKLWPTPHHPMFDFERTAEGPEWIDVLARRARRSLSNAAGQTAVGHSDWAVKDFRFEGSRPRVVYDWESLALDGEAVLVGEAARGFTMTWHLDVPAAPTLAETRAFVEEYEAARGTAFSLAEHSTVAAAATYAAAYTARCEHALDPAARSYSPGSFRRLLADHGEELFALLGR